MCGRRKYHHSNTYSEYCRLLHSNSFQQFWLYCFGCGLCWNHSAVWCGCFCSDFSTWRRLWKCNCSGWNWSNQLRIKSCKCDSGWDWYHRRSYCILHWYNSDFNSCWRFCYSGDGTINTLGGGALTISSFTSYSADQDNSNDTLNTVNTIAQVPNPPSGLGGQRCGAGPIVISAVANDTIYWFDAPTGGNLLFVGNTFSIPFLSATTTYYAQTGNICPTQTRTPVCSRYRSIASCWSWSGCHCQWFYFAWCGSRICIVCMVTTWTDNTVYYDL